ncbi:endonuclease/exonuclease/phosphatase family protein [Candidatus Colwellia aromaticivorans]|uniref:endonuclease/exonuclease/phosphatase family protein n=1 Tax=Candidatus Colwellia aromaticivorans TaxID=2267621 RepID=UPI000DF328A5|nr:endonuclease/exonuclease/phosphatase family protein [Candidatus Colwellia aromaticivorans]
MKLFILHGSVKLLVLIFCSLVISSKGMTIETPTNLRVATFNVSMEALNYAEKTKQGATKIKRNELTHALQNDNQQIKNIAEIIQRVNPDIILLNEFDRVDDSATNIRYFINKYLGKSQRNQQTINYPYFYQGAVNTGVKVNSDLNHDGRSNQLPTDAHGFGHFIGHFGMVLLSKYPIDEKAIRTFQKFKWHNMPNALKPINPETNQPWYTEETWKALRLSSKSHWDIPISINDETIHILASHPTPPVFDGPENRNGNRNHDEIRFWFDYINTKQGDYIYDDNHHKGALKANERFIIIGDQNASRVEGDAVITKTSQGIIALLSSDKIQDSLPTSLGGKYHSSDNINGIHHTADWRMRADYVLPSTFGFIIKQSGVFWPQQDEDTYRLIKNRQASSDHRLVWVDVELIPNKVMN